MRTTTEESSRACASGQEVAYSLAVVRKSAFFGYADEEGGAIPCQWLGLFASSITTSKHAIMPGSVRTTGRGHTYTPLEFWLLTLHQSTLIQFGIGFITRHDGNLVPLLDAAGPSQPLLCVTGDVRSIWQMRRSLCGSLLWAWPPH